MLQRYLQRIESLLLKPAIVLRRGRVRLHYGLASVEDGERCVEDLDGLRLSEAWAREWPRIAPPMTPEEFATVDDSPHG